MKTYIPAAAILLAFCTGCQSSNFLADRLGAKDRLSQLKEAADQANLSDSGPPSPTNFDPRPGATSAASVDEHLRLGELELTKDRNLEALGHFQKALEADPQHAEANHRMAVVCDKLGKFDKAERHYTIALQNDPRNVAVLSDLGYSYWLQGRHSESERFLRKALEVDSEYETAIANLGMLYGSTGRQDEALAMFRKIGEESQVQQIMQQIAAMSSPSQRPNDPPVPAKSTESVTPSGLIEKFASEDAVRTASFETSRDLSQVNGPTREILQLMEQGRRQQQLADARQRQEGMSLQPSHQAQSVPLSATRQLGEPQLRQAPVPLDATGPPSGSDVPQRVPDHLLNQALADIDRQGHRVQPGRPITIGPNTLPLQFDARAGQAAQALAVDQLQRAAPSNENWWDSNPTNSAAVIEAGPVPANPLNPIPQDASLTPQPWPHDALPQSHAVSTAWQNQGPAPQAAISYGDPQPPSQFAEPRPVQPHNPSAMQHAAGPMRESAAFPVGDPLNPVPQPFEYAGQHQPLGAASPIDPPMGTSIDRIDPQSLAADASPNTAASQWPVVSSAEATPDDAYLQARREAALMGLQAGPGELFPYVHHTQRATPGTASRWNGAAYPQPNPYVPPVPNADQLIPVPPVAHAAAESFGQSQPLPYGVNRIHHPPQYDMRGSDSPGTVHHFTPEFRDIPQPRPPTGGSQAYGASHQPPAHSPVALAGTHTYGNQYGNQPHPSPYAARAPAVPATPSQGGVLHMYDNVRQQQNQQLNGLIHHTYGQSPQSPPYSVGAPHSHTVNTLAMTANTPPPWNGRSSASVDSPATGSYYTLPPGEATPVPSSASGPSNVTAPRASTYVVPEPYHAQRRTAQRQPPHTYHSANQRSGDSYHGPTIVPSAPSHLK